MLTTYLPTGQLIRIYYIQFVLDWEEITTGYSPCLKPVVTLHPFAPAYQNGLFSSKRDPSQGESYTKASDIYHEPFSCERREGNWPSSCF
jgi:hypothetical protein